MRDKAHLKLQSVISIYNLTALKKLTINFHEYFFLIFTSAKHEWKLKEKILTSENLSLILKKQLNYDIIPNQ